MPTLLIPQLGTFLLTLAALATTTPACSSAQPLDISSPLAHVLWPAQLMQPAPKQQIFQLLQAWDIQDEKHLLILYHIHI